MWGEVPRSICPGLFARAQGRVRAGGLVAGGEAGPRLLDINNTHKQGGGDGEGWRRALDGSGPGSPPLQKKLRHRPPFGALWVHSHLSVSTPFSHGAEASPPKPLFSRSLAASPHPHPL